MTSKTTRRQFLQRTGSAGISAAAFGILSRRAHADISTQPNILLFFPDQHRPDWTSINKSLVVRTPNLEKFAQGGVRFTQAICPSPLCAPSRACLALGREYDRTGVLSNKDNVPDGSHTLYTRLREAGYRVGGVGKFDLRKGAFDWGIDGRHRVNGRDYFDEWGFTDGLDSEGKGATLRGIINREDPANARGNAPYTHFLTERKDGSLRRYLEWWEKSRAAENGWAYTTPMDIADDAYNDNWVGGNGLNLIKNYPKDKPWFLQVNFPGPHPPVDITPTMAEWYKDATFPQPHKNDEFKPDHHVAIRRNYSAMVENIDTWFGKYLAEIEARGELDRTVIVWSSDHGEMLGDHNRWGKSVPYHASLGVPLIVAGPGVRRGATHDGPTTTLDLTATFLDYAGAPQLDGADSRTLRRVLTGDDSKGREHVTSGLGKWRTVFDGRYKLITGFDPTQAKGEKAAEEGGGAEVAPLLFDLQKDSLEDTNIVDAQPEVVERLAKLLPKTATKTA